jgi:Tfp pilus assembly protein PilO
MRLERDQWQAGAFLGAVVLVFVVGHAYPRQREEVQLRARIEKAQQALGFDRKSAQSLVQLASEVEQLQRTVDSVDRLVPETPELATLLRAVGEALKSQGVRDEEIVAQPVVRGKQYSVIPLSLTFRGGFPQAFAAIKHVEDLKRLIRVHRVELLRGNQGLSAPLDVRIELCAFQAPKEG